MSELSWGGGAHIFGHTRSAAAALSIAASSLADVVTQPLRRHTERLQCTQTGCHITMATQTQTRRLSGVFTAIHSNVNNPPGFLLQTSAQPRQSSPTWQKSSSHVPSLLFLRFRMGGIPARTHREDKLLIYLGIIDILQSYR